MEEWDDYPKEWDAVPTALDDDPAREAEEEYEREQEEAFKYYYETVLEKEIEEECRKLDLEIQQLIKKLEDQNS